MKNTLKRIIMKISSEEFVNNITLKQYNVKMKA